MILNGPAAVTAVIYELAIDECRRRLVRVHTGPGVLDEPAMPNHRARPLTKNRLIHRARHCQPGQNRRDRFPRSKDESR